MVRPRWYSLLLLAIALAGFGSAAHWQWRRAEFKDAREQAFRAVLKDGDAPALDQLLTRLSDAEFALVELDARLDRRRLLLLDNQVHHGVVGVKVYAPLHTNTGQALLLDLGFVARPDRRYPALIPDLPARIRGLALLMPAPAAGLRLGDPAALEAARYPLLLNRIEPVELRRLLALPELSASVLRLAPDPASGFVREWALPGLSAERHRGYALQWASFAIASLVLFAFVHHPRRKSP